MTIDFDFYRQCCFKGTSHRVKDTRGESMGRTSDWSRMMRMGGGIIGGKLEKGNRKGLLSRKGSRISSRGCSSRYRMIKEMKEINIFFSISRHSPCISNKM